MNGLILALAMVGQTAQPKDLAVRIRTSEGSMTGYGSGTILASNEAGQELVLTAKHVTKDARRAWVQYRGQDYPVRKIHQSTRADLAAVEVDLPGKFADVPVSQSPGRHSLLWGYGQSGGLHQHSMSFMGDHPGWQEYTPGGNEGDSGSGVWDEAGDLTGVFVAKDVSNRNAVVVSSYELCQFLGGRTAGSGSRRVVIFPFFWSRTTWNNGAGSSTCPPGQTCQPLEPISQPITVNPVNPPSQGGVTVTAPGVGVQVGPVGTTGPAGPVGPPGASPDPNAIAQAVITAVLKEIQGNPAYKGTPGTPGPTGPAGAVGATGPAGPAGTIPNLANLGITFTTPNVDGTTSSQFVPIGPPGGPGQPATIGFKLPDTGLSARVAALEAKVNATPATSTTGK